MFSSSPPVVWIFQEVFSSSGFNELSDDALAFILQSDKLMLEEEQILDKVTEWASIVSVSTT